jgi:hypothetical protein
MSTSPMVPRCSSPTTNSSPKRYRRALALATVLAILLGWFRIGPALATDTVTSVCPSRFAIVTSGSTLQVPYCSNKSLSTADPTVTRLVVVVHGDERNADDYYRYTVEAATTAGAGSSLIVAPQFLTSDDLQANGLPGDTLYWSSGGWKEGNASQTSPYSRPWTISSFSVVDKLVEQVSNRAVFPNLRQVVFAGHSAGGQFVDRYAAGTQVEQKLNAFGNSYRYVVANPSSYLYLNGDRPKDGGFGPLTKSEVRACSGYNTFKYGVDKGLNSYMSAVGPTAIRAQFKTRNVAYLLGSLDTDPNSTSLDASCEGKWQGAQRLARGSSFYQYLGQYYGSTVYATQTISIVDGVGHEGRKMINSEAGRLQLFG